MDIVIVHWLLVEFALVFGAPLAYLLRRRASPAWYRRVVAAGCGWLVIVTIGLATGLTLAPPLHVLVFPASVVSGWLIVWSVLRGAEGAAWKKLVGRVVVGGLLVVNYGIATVGVLGVGFGVSGAEPEARTRLVSGVVVEAVRIGGPGVDFRGYRVQIREELPVAPFIQREGPVRVYESSQSGRIDPPTFEQVISGRRTGVLVHLPEWSTRGGTDPDTIWLR